MKASVRVLRVFCLVAVGTVSDAFVPRAYPQVSSRTATRVGASTQEADATATATKPKVQELGLLTFDLDDTLYPIEPVVKAANGKTWSDGFFPLYPVRSKLYKGSVEYYKANICQLWNFV